MKYAMNRSIIVSLLFIGGLFLGCDTEKFVSEPGETRGAERLKIVVDPTSGYASQTVRIEIIARQFTWTHAYVTFNDLIPDVDCIRGSVMYARVPYRAKSGRVILHSGDLSIEGPRFTVVHLCDDSVCVTNYSGPTIQESDAWVDTRSYMGPVEKWRASISHDTVKLSQDFRFGDDGHIWRIINFELSRTDGPPRCIGGMIIDHELLGDDTLDLKGVAEIQDWDTSGVVSGRVSYFRDICNTGYWWYYYFWYDFKQSK